MELTPEQKAYIDAVEVRMEARLKSTVAALDKQYAARAKGFRAWINRKALEESGVWVAQRFSTVAFLAGAGLVYGVLHLLGRV